MITLTATGSIYSISPVIDIPSKSGGNSFQKRELVIDDTWTDRENVVHPNYVVIEFTGDKMPILDQFVPGQRVTVEAYINGREYNGKIFNTIKGRSVALYQQQGYTSQPQQVSSNPVLQSAPAPSYGTYAPQPSYPQQPAYPQPAPFPGQYPTNSRAPQDLGPEGLPFR